MNRGIDNPYDWQRPDGKNLGEAFAETAKERKALAERLMPRELTGEAAGPAHWLQRKQNGYAVLVCSACEKQKEGNARTAYCPNCGRPMAGEEEQG